MPTRNERQKQWTEVFHGNEAATDAIEVKLKGNMYESNNPGLPVVRAPATRSFCGGQFDLF
jgi:hypothetical protein